MAADVLKNSTKTVPRSSPKIKRVSLDFPEMAAREGFVRGSIKKNDMTIKHVKGG